MVRLGVNVDHIATVRQARRGQEPDPVEAALSCERAGADTIVCHLREDRRHIQDGDVRRLLKALHTRLNLEMSIAPDIVSVALAVTPCQITLVPERRQELTTEGGLDVVRLRRALAPVVRRFKHRGILVSLFVDPLARQVRAAHALGAEVIELHTGGYANARTASVRTDRLAVLADAARLGKELGLVVAAGHGLDYCNVRAIAAIPEIDEVNIGFSIISRALEIGLDRAVREMIALLRAAERTYARQAT